MPIPPQGISYTPLILGRSLQNPSLAWEDQLSVTGSLTVSVGTFAPRGRTIKRTAVVGFAGVPSANANYVYVVPGPTPDTYTILVRKSDFTASTTAILVNIIVAIGSSQGQ